MSVYFITCRDLDVVKIGYAYNPISRLRTLQVACPFELALEGAIPGGFDKEGEFHLRYAKWRLRGEWFRLTPSIEEEIAKSTRPKRFTWGSARKWVADLEREHEAQEWDAKPPEVREAIELHFQQRMEEAERRSRMSYLERREADGDIHFPFRAKEQA